MIKVWEVMLDVLEMNKTKLYTDFVKQYGENEAKRQNLVVSFLAAIAISFASLGYSLKYLLIDAAPKAFILLTIAFSFSVIIFSIIEIISIFFSYSLRRDQIKVDQIREELLGRDNLFYDYKAKISIQDFFKIIISSAFALQIIIVILFLYLSFSVENIGCSSGCCIFTLCFFSSIVASLISYFHYRLKLLKILQKK